MLCEKRDLVQYAILVTLEESNTKFNQAIQFSSYTGKMYCLYFKGNSIFNEPQIIVPTLFDEDEENRFEVLMLNKNIERVKEETLDCIAYDREWYEPNELY